MAENAPTARDKDYLPRTFHPHFERTRREADADPSGNTTQHRKLSPLFGNEDDLILPGGS